MTSISFWASTKKLALFLPVFLSVSSSAAQFGSAQLTVEPPKNLVVKPGASVTIPLTAKLANGYHTNSSTPSEDYLIPFRLTLEASPMVVQSIEYPKGELEKYDFADKPLSVYTGTIELTAKLQAPPSTPKGPKVIIGKVRYQACTKTACFPPKTVSIQIPIDVR